MFLMERDKVLDPIESVTLLAKTAFPGNNDVDDKKHHRNVRKKASGINDVVHNDDYPLFTLCELKTAVASFNHKKEPGEDGLTVDVCMYAILQLCTRQKKENPSRCLKMAKWKGWLHTRNRLSTTPRSSTYEIAVHLSGRSNRGTMYTVTNR